MISLKKDIRNSLREIILAFAIAIALAGCHRSRDIVIFDVEEVRVRNKGATLEIVAYKTYNDMGAVIRCTNINCVGEPVYESDSNIVSLYIDTTIYHHCYSWHKVYACAVDSSPSPCSTPVMCAIIPITSTDTLHITDGLWDTLYCKNDTFYYENITTCKFRSDSGFVPVAIISSSGDSINVRGAGKMFFLPYTGGHLAPLPPDGYVPSYTLPPSGDTLVFWYDSDGDHGYSEGDAFGTLLTTGTALWIVYTTSTGFRGIATYESK